MNEGLKLSPKDEDMLRTKAGIYFQKGDIENATKHFNEVLSISPIDVRSLSWLGIIHQLQGEANKALEFFDRALNINPNDSISLLNKANLMADLSLKKEAIEVYDKALEEMDKVSFIGNEPSQENAFKLAKAIGLVPQMGKTLFNKGYTLMEIGDFENSISCFEEALQNIYINDTDRILSIQNKSLAESIIGNLEQARKTIESLIEVYPEKGKELAYITDLVLREKDKTLRKDLYYRLLYHRSLEYINDRQYCIPLQIFRKINEEHRYSEVGEIIQENLRILESLNLRV